MSARRLDPARSPMDQAIAARLAKLDAMPVDITGLEKRLRAALPARRPTWGSHVRSFAAVAASLLLVASVFLFAFQGREVRADPAQMIQLHEDLVAGRIPSQPAATVEQANALLASQWSSQEPLRLPMPPEDQLHACCMRPLENKKVACVLLDYQGAKVTMSVAKAADFAMPAQPQGKTIGGNTYYLQEAQGYSMVMTERKGLWVCLVSKLTPGELTTLATQLQF